MRTIRLAAPILIILAAACGGAPGEASDATADSVAPGMVTGTTGAPGPGTAGTPGTPGATDPDTIRPAADSATPR